MAKFLVTGGAGFIGSNITDKLLNDGHFVRVLDNFSTGKKENLLNAASHKHFELMEGDLRDTDVVRKATDGIDFVLHQAAIPSVQKSIEDPITTNAVNINGTLNVLKASVDNKVKRVVYAASSSAYGNTCVLPKKENMIPLPLSPYAVSKLTGEYYCNVFSQVYDIETVSLRYFNIFGPRQDPKSMYAAVVPRFITAILKGDRPIVYGNGEQSRDFTHIDNVVQANINACSSPGVSGKVFNVACGNRYTLNELLSYIEGITGKNANPDYEEERKGDVKHSQGDIAEAIKYLGYKVIVDFKDGLKKTIEYFSTI